AISFSRFTLSALLKRTLSLANPLRRVCALSDCISTQLCFKELSMDMRKKLCVMPTASVAKSKRTASAAVGTKQDSVHVSKKGKGMDARPVRKQTPHQQWFCTYAGETKRVMTASEIKRWCEDLGIDPDGNALLALCWKLNVARIGFIEEKEFTEGMETLS